MTRDLIHTTLQTGHSWISPRGEVREDVLSALAPLVARAVAGPMVPLPIPGYAMQGAEHGRCAVVTIYAQPTEGGPPEPVPILTVGIAGHSRCGAAHWRALHDRDGLATDPARQPPTPWLADRIEVGMARHPDAASWSGDWSRCVAWAWLGWQSWFRVGEYEYRTRAR